MHLLCILGSNIYVKVHSHMPVTSYGYVCGKETEEITEEAEGDRGFRWRLQSGRILVLRQEKQYLVVCYCLCKEYEIL